MKKCRYCHEELGDQNNICPVCGKKQAISPVFIVIIVIVLFAVLVAIFGSDMSETTDTNNDKKDEAEKVSSDVSDSEASADKDLDDSVPTEYRNALSKAETYSDLMHMSKQGIYDQLVSEYGEQFSVEAAQYAMDNLQVDWKTNALEKAKDYQETMQMSKAAIYEQLVSEYGEKFTAEEAQYAVDNLN